MEDITSYPHIKQEISFNAIKKQNYSHATRNKKVKSGCQLLLNFHFSEVIMLTCQVPSMCLFLPCLPGPALGGREGRPPWPPRQRGPKSLLAKRRRSSRAPLEFVSKLSLSLVLLRKKDEWLCT
jgi:hypothetical protein